MKPQVKESKLKEQAKQAALKAEKYVEMQSTPKQNKKGDEAPGPIVHVRKVDQKAMEAKGFKLVSGSVASPIVYDRVKK